MRKITKLLFALIILSPELLFAQNSSVKVTPTAPVANFSPQADSICGSFTVLNFMDLSTNTPTSWKWYFPGATPDTSTLKNPTNITYSGYGCYTVKVVVKNSSGSDSLTKTNCICLDAPPHVVFTGRDSIKCATSAIDTITATGALQYHWSTGATASTIIVSPLTSTVYTVEVSSGSCFMDTTFFVFVETCLGIPNISEQPQISLYPNPTNSYLTITIEKPLGKVSYLSIIDITGRELISQDINTSQLQFNTNVSSLANGIYLLKLKTDEGIIVKKFVKD